MVFFVDLRFLFLMLWDDTLLGGDICDGVEARSRSGRRHTVSVAKMTGETMRNP